MAENSTGPSEVQRPPLPRDPLLGYVLVLLAIAGSIALLYIGQSLFVPLFIAGIFTFLLLPLCNWLVRRKFPLGLAAAVSCLLMLLVFFGILGFLGWKYAQFGEDIPTLQRALMQRITTGQEWLEARFHITQGQQSDWLSKELSDLTSSGAAMLMGIFSATGSALATAVIIPIITFFLLLMKARFREFFSRLDGSGQGAVLRVVENISKLSRKWLKGVLTVMAFLAVLDSLGFMALGLQYPVLLGITAALLNVIPYAGPWLGALMPLLIAFLTKDSAMYAVGVVAVIGFTQFIDNNFITPKVVGSSVQINPLASMLALIAWGMLWGLMGLILALPITGMMKLVFDEIPSLKPWGYILGEDKHWPKDARSGMMSLPSMQPQGKDGKRKRKP